MGQEELIHLCVRETQEAHRRRLQAQDQPSQPLFTQGGLSLAPSTALCSENTDEARPSKRSADRGSPGRRGEKGRQRGGFQPSFGEKVTFHKAGSLSPPRPILRPCPARDAVGGDVGKGARGEQRCRGPAGLCQALSKALAVTEPLAKSVGHGRLSRMSMAVRWAPGHPLWKVMAGGATGGRVKTPQVSLGWEDGGRAAGPLGQRKGAHHCQEHRGPSLLVSDAWEAFFRP